MVLPTVREGEQVVIYRDSGRDLATDIVPLLDHPRERAAFLLRFHELTQAWGVTL